MLGKLDQLFFGARTYQKLQINALDGVRGLAVLFVLFSHSAGVGLVLFEDFVFAGNGSGQIGVWLFFVLSAFLLTRGLIKKNNKVLKSPIIWIDYSVRRILRIFPLFTVVVLFIWFVSRMGFNFYFGDFDLFAVWEHLTLQTGKQHLWTIGIEFRYYLILPIFVCIYVFLIKRNFWLTTVLVFIIFVISRTYFLPAPFLKYLPLFLAGSYFAVLNEWYLQKKYHLPKVVFTIVGILILGYSLVMMPNTYQMFFGTEPRLGASHFAQWGIMFGLLIFIVINEAGPINRIFVNKAFRFLGIISFSVYIWHWFVLYWVIQSLNMSTLSGIFIFYSTCLIVAGISFLIFERPFSRIRVLKRSEYEPVNTQPMPNDKKITTT